LLTWLYLCWALRHQVLDQPNHRSSHTRPIPRGGGVGIVLPIIVCLFLWGRHPGSPLLVIGLGVLVLAGVSWLDDLRGLPALLRLAVHVGVAAGVVAALGVNVPLPGPLADSHWLSAGIMTAWIVIHINYYNFMDGIDGLAASQTMLLGLAWMLTSRWHNNASVTVVGCLLLAANLGFLIFNWPPAKIFMGDVGSASLGFFASILPMLSTSPSGNNAFVFAGIVSWPFIFDATATLARRLFRGDNLLKAHRLHHYQLLVSAGWSHRTVTLLYTGWSLACVAVGLYWLSDRPHSAVVVSLVLILPAVSLAIFTPILCKPSSELR
jgi:UDP-N-acetylmuramyl pentapeptide phosphotransferase/UDP-N-acetylglucosamine-1-phosphate transferase